LQCSQAAEACYHKIEFDITAAAATVSVVAANKRRQQQLVNKMQSASR
jgi:hypothetical protein